MYPCHAESFADGSVDSQTVGTFSLLHMNYVFNRDTEGQALPHSEDKGKETSDEKSWIHARCKGKEKQVALSICNISNQSSSPSRKLQTF